MRIAPLALLLALVMAAPAAASFPDNSAVMLSSVGEWVTGGVPRAYDDRNATLTLTGTSGDVTLQIAGGDGSKFSMEFAAKPGTSLQPGVYKNVERAAFRSANRAGMDISGNGHGCNTITGWFEVKDFAVDSTGQVQRLQILYEQHCDGLPPAIFGEVRYGEPAGVTPSELRWPDSDFGSPAAPGAVLLLSPAPVTVADASITGSGADAFAIHYPTCIVGSPCPPPTGAGVVFEPSSPGTRSATLHITDSDGTAYTVPLRASASR